MKSLFLGGLTGFLFAGVLVSLVLFAVTIRKSGEAQVGWTLVDVVAATQDLPVGSRLSADHFKVDPMPEQFVTPSHVLAEELQALVGKTLTMPVQQNDLLVLSALAERPEGKMIAACVHALQPVYARELKRSLDAAFERVAESQARNKPARDLPAAPPPDAKGEVEVLVATRELPEGAILATSDVVSRRIPATMLTQSHIPTGEGEVAIGGRLIVSVQEGDWLMWQLLDHPEQTVSQSACLASAAAAQRQVNEEFLPAELSRHFSSSAEGGAP